MTAPEAPSPYVSDPVQGVALLLWATDPDRPETLATPFHQAAAAAALEVPVELYFTARSVHLLVPGVAGRLKASPRTERTVADAMQDAHEHGVRFYACTDALQAQGLAGQALIEACSGHGGALQFMLRAIDRGWRTMVF